MSEPGHGPGRLLVLVGLVVFVLGLIGLDARATYGARVSADEPQYLLTALSLAEDLDLDISDEITEERFRPFHEVALDPQTIELNDSGQRLSPHDPLLPVILALPMALGGWAGAKVALALLTGLTAATTLYVAANRFGVPSPVAAVVVVAFYAAPPLSVYATQVYPEMPAALCTVAGLAGVTGRGRRWSWLAVAAVVALPWLGVKYLPVAAVLGLAWAVRAVAIASGDGTHRGVWSRRASQLGALSGHRPVAGSGRLTALAQAGTLAVAAVAYLVIHQRIYGGWTVYAAGDHFVDGEWQVVGVDPDYAGRSRRLVGLLVDRGFGLAAWNPALLALPPALAVMARRRQPGWVPLTLALAAGWATATWMALTMHGWWWPGRQVVVILPLAVIAVAVAVGHSTRRLGAVVAGCTVAALTWWWLAWEASTDRRTLIVDFEATAAPWYRVWRSVLPDHRRFDPVDQALTVAWTVALSALALVAWRRTPGPTSSSDSTVAGPGAGSPIELAAAEPVDLTTPQ